MRFRNIAPRIAALLILASLIGLAAACESGTGVSGESGGASENRGDASVSTSSERTSEQATTAETTALTASTSEVITSTVSTSATSSAATATTTTTTTATSTTATATASVTTTSETVAQTSGAAEDPVESKPTDDDTTTDALSAASRQDALSIYESISSSAAMPELFSLEADMIPDFYGVAREDYVDAVFYLSVDSMLADEVVVAVASNEDAAKRIENALLARMKYKADEAITYSPEQYAVIERSFVKREGLTLCMCVTPNIDAAAIAFETAIN